MDYLPPSIQRWLEGSIDPHSQHLIETYSQSALIALTALAFLVSFVSKSVTLGIEAFGVGFLLLLLATVPPWPFFNRRPIKFLPVRTAQAPLT